MNKIYITLLAIGLLITNVNGQEKPAETENTKKDIVLTAPNSDFKITLFGRMYLDGVHYFDDVTDLSSKASIRDIRLGTKIQWEKWDAKINISFGKNKLNIKDAFLRYNHAENSSLKIGNFFEPFGIETAASSKETRFIGGSNTSQAFGFGRSLGIAYTYYNDKLYASTGLFVGKVDNNHYGDQGYSTTSKLVYAPISNDNLTVQFGASFSYRKPEANGFSEDFNDDDFNRVVDITAGPEEKFLNAEIEGAESDMRYNFQTLVLAKSFLFQAEYSHSEVKRDEDYISRLMKDGPAYSAGSTWPTSPEAYPSWYGDLREISTEGYYVQAGFLLGDSYSYNSSTSYINRPKAGSYEFLIRYDDTNLNDIDGMYLNGVWGPDNELSALGGAGNKSIAGGKAKTYSVAMNYYLNNNIMFRLNYSLMDVDNINHPLDENVGVLNARIQVQF